MKRIIPLALAGMMVLTGGCVFDEDSGKDDTGKVTSIGELSLGGGVFYFKNEGYAIAEFGAFYGNTPYENARVFVNGLELQNKMGIFTNVQPLATAFIDNGQPVRIAVYALGDSVVHSLVLPHAPVIQKPLENAQLAVGDSLTVEIDYPGDHQFISMAFDNQDKVVAAFETNEKKLTLAVSGSKIITAGKSNLTAMASNASGPIPQNVDLTKQYKVFLVSTLAVRVVTFTGK
jgi:hypothetical protein